MSHHSVSSSRQSSPRISVDADRSVTVGSSADSSTSTTSSSSSNSERSDASRPVGRFNAGMIDGTASAAQAPALAPAQADADCPPVIDTRAMNTIHSAQSDRPLCPAPVRCIIQSASLLVGGGGLTMTIYGGVRINGQPVPELDPNRAENIGFMVGGMLLVMCGLVAFMATQMIHPSGNKASGAQPG